MMGNWLFLKGFNAKSRIRYIEELPSESETQVEGHLLKQKGRMTQMKGIIRSAEGNQIFAEAEGFFMNAN